MAVVLLVMSVGVLFGRKPVEGSCGGMNNIDGLKECEICGGKPQACTNKTPR
ncbi:MAG: (Na+)-NQR maturation NqrM [Pseudohongiellaceae bacterium]